MVRGCMKKGGCLLEQPKVCRLLDWEKIERSLRHIKEEKSCFHRMEEKKDWVGKEAREGSSYQTALVSAVQQINNPSLEDKLRDDPLVILKTVWMILNSGR